MKSELFEGWISNGPSFKCCELAIAIVPTIQNQDIFVWISNGFWQKGGHLSGFHLVGLPDFRSHSKSGTNCNPTSFWPFEIQTNPDFVTAFLQHDFKSVSANKVILPFRKNIFQMLNVLITLQASQLLLDTNNFTWMDILESTALFFCSTKKWILHPKK